MKIIGFVYWLVSMIYTFKVWGIMWGIIYIFLPIFLPIDIAFYIVDKIINIL